MPTMTKRKSPEKGDVKVRKKRQAFNSTKDRAIKAKSEHNERHSMFAKLPSELRRHIWKYVLGNGVLHLYRTHSTPSEKDPAWKLVACNDDRTPSQLWDYWTQERCSDDPSTWESPYRRYEEAALSSLKSIVLSHFGCTRTLSPLYDDNDDRENPVYPQVDPLGQNLALLRSCRMIYHEANHVLWTSNTFSFNDCYSFSEFVKFRTSLQLRLLTKLHFSLEKFNFRHLPELQDWHRTFSGTRIKKLTGLKELHLYLTKSFLYRFRTGRESVEMDLSQHNVIIDFIQNFTIQSIRVATIIVDDDDYHDENMHLSKSKCLEWVEETRRVLVDPDGAAKWQMRHDAQVAAASAHQRRIGKLLKS